MLCTALVLAATVFRGSNRWVVLMVLEWAALMALVLMVRQSLNGQMRWEGLGVGGRRWALLALVFSPLWMAAIQLVPMPSGEGWRPLSLTPDATWASALAALPPMLMMLAALGLSSSAVRRLVVAWIAVAVAQALLGLAQLTGQEWLYFGMPRPQGSIGTFANRNHFASFLAMSIPLVLWAIWFQMNKRQQRDPRMVWALGLALFLVLMALLASLSRTGQLLGVVAAVACAWLIWKPKRLERSLSAWAWTLVPLLALAALGVGGMEWLSRFDVALIESSAAERALNRNAALQGAWAHWPMGSGLGSFAAVFPRYQPASVPQLVDFAHNEYAQWLMEGGLLAVAAMAVAVVLLVQRLVQMATHAKRKPGQRRSASGHGLDRTLVSVCVTGLGVALLHAWVDFPLRIPANAMLACFLAGIVLRSPPAIGPREPESTNP